MRIWVASLTMALVLAACGGADSAAVPDSKPVTTAAVNSVNDADHLVIAKANALGAQIFQTQCLACHSAENIAEKAPPMFGVKDHVIKAYPERDAFIQRVANWVKAPNADDVLMPGAVKKFGLMPAMPQLSDQDAQAVAAFLFDMNLNEPDWYKAHYQAEHGVKP